MIHSIALANGSKSSEISEHNLKSASQKSSPDSSLNLQELTHFAKFRIHFHVGNMRTLRQVSYFSLFPYLQIFPFCTAININIRSIFKHFLPHWNDSNFLCWQFTNLELNLVLEKSLMKIPSSPLSKKPVLTNIN